MMPEGEEEELHGPIAKKKKLIANIFRGIAFGLPSFQGVLDWFLQTETREERGC